MTELDLIVSAIKNIQRYAELSGGRFSTLTDSLKIATLFCNDEGKIVSINQQALKLLHASSDSALKLQLGDVFIQVGIDLVERMREQPTGLGKNPIDCVLVDVRGARFRVSILVQPLDIFDTGAAHAMIIFVPESKRADLHHALARSGSTFDYLSNFLLLAQEAERKRIASDLHDGLGQVLTMLKFRVEDALIRLNADKIQETEAILKEVVVQLRGSVGEVRRISTELRPSMLDDLGLLPTLHWYCRQFEAAHSGTSVTLDAKIKEDLIPIPIKLPAFRMIQEATTNIAKHARAKNVFIYIRAQNNGFLVGIVDDGVGFDAERLTSGAACLLGVGINSMRERVEASQGAFRIRSQAGVGTAISAIWGAKPDDFQWTGAWSLEGLSLSSANTQPLDLDLTH